MPLLNVENPFQGQEYKATSNSAKKKHPEKPVVTSDDVRQRMRVKLMACLLVS